MLATGAELKNTFCLARDRYAFLSHHIGDLENYETLRSFEEGIAHFERLFRVNPERSPATCTPITWPRAMRSSAQATKGCRWCRCSITTRTWQPAWRITAGIPHEPVIGLSFDGTGYGTDGAIWGGEVLVGGYADYQRRYHLAYVPLPGGDQAVRKPARMALAHLWSAGLEWEPDLPPVEALCAEERTVLDDSARTQDQCPADFQHGPLL